MTIKNTYLNMYFRNITFVVMFVYISLPSSYRYSESSLKFLHHSDVVKKVKLNFKSLKTYKAKFYISTKTNNNNTKKIQGNLYYQKKNKLRLEFVKPYGDYIISDGAKLWVYIHSLNAVGLQRLDTKALYGNLTQDGLVQLFQRYHYNFVDLEQPKKIDSKYYYVLSLKEKVSSGGYHHLLLHVDTKTYMIQKVIGKTQEKTIILRLKDIEVNVELPNKLFYYKNKGNTKVVENPLTIN